MKALILAAGYATRLYPLTKEFPKPLLEVNNRPIIDYIVDKLDEIDEIDEIIVVTNSKFISFFKKWKSASKTKKHISLVDDLTKTLASRRGAIGDMFFAINKRQIKDDLLVIGGDNLFDARLKDFLGFCRLKKVSPVIGAYNIKSKIKARNYGVVKLDSNKKIISFQEKPRSPGSTFVAMCLYYFPKGKVNSIKQFLGSKEKKRDATGSYIGWLSKKSVVYGFIFSGKWYDIGDYQFYHEAERRFTN